MKIGIITISQLKLIYSQLPQKIQVLVRNGETLENISKALLEVASSMAYFGNECKEIDNPNYPEESYEAFVLFMGCIWN